MSGEDVWHVFHIPKLKERPNVGNTIKDWTVPKFGIRVKGFC